MADHIYRLSGEATGSDGAKWFPEYWGDFFGVCRVRDSIANGCVKRGEMFSLTTDRYSSLGGDFVARVGLVVWNPTREKVVSDV